MNTINPFTNAMKKLKDTVHQLGLSEDMYERLSKPDRILEQKLKIKMDNGQEKEFEAYRVQFNNARGPYKGGIRFHPRADLDEVKTLAFLMAAKCAVANIPMGGGKGGIQVDSKELSEKELERLSRAWVDAFYEYIGPDKDIPAPDVYTTPKIMTWMVDEYSQRVGKPAPAAFTGKPIDHGGSEGREYSTAQGGFYALRELANELKLEPQQTRVVVQGFGNVGYHTARILHEHGYKIIGLSDSKGGIFSEAGLDPKEVMNIKKEKGYLGFGSCEGPACTGADHRHVSNQELLELDTDILVPAALENQITEENADRIKARAVIEMANGPITPEADVLLFKKGIHVVPDILANSGGVVVSYFEWLQNLQNEHWSEADVLDKLKKIITTEFQNIWTIAQTKKIDLRSAAYLLGIGRIVEAMKAKTP
jgi:glutamate dehydrogenase (NADP+)